jgi:hypothetical protein
MSGTPAPLFTAHLVDAALRYVTSLGGSSQWVRARAVLPSTSSIHDTLSDICMIMRILECAAEEIRDPYFSLNLSRKVELRVFGTISFTVANAPAVGIGFNNIIRCQATYSLNFRCFYECRETAMASS